mmetsp:Transcript_279/g.519  ORF Transcript_279/g.519 Transcript_279/m.519 type:complete len:149 (-) Transcript_279:11-457(-)
MMTLRPWAWQTAQLIWKICCPRMISPADAAGTPSPIRSAPDSTALRAAINDFSDAATRLLSEGDDWFSTENDAAVADRYRQISRCSALLGFIRRIVFRCCFLFITSTTPLQWHSCSLSSHWVSQTFHQLLCVRHRRQREQRSRSQSED